MKTAFTRININAPFPCHQAGFIQQTYDVNDYNDDLYARIAYFDDGNHKVVHISCDNLGLPISVQNELNNYFKEIDITISCTHTHFACSPHNNEYTEYLKNKLIDAIDNLEIKERNLTLSYQCVPFTEVGKSRISNHEANVLLQLLTFRENDNPVFVFIAHNCHPTIMNGDTPFFSKEYPGYALEKLIEKFPDTFFTFSQGADGDISTRFTRQAQNYKEVQRLGTLLADKVSSMLQEEIERIPFNSVSYDKKIINLEHTFEDIDMSNVSSDLTPRELETIKIGAVVRKNLAKKLDTLPKEATISRIKFGNYKVIFCPNELFSYYIQAINTDDSILICYSNGYAPYVTGIGDDFITYESFTDTLTLETKKRLFDELHNLSYEN